MQSLFEMLFVVSNSGKICTWKKSFVRRNLNYRILGTKGFRKLKFDEVTFHICQKIVRAN